jgi:outer membrane receptor protein involved in Fe transport
MYRQAGTARAKTLAQTASDHRRRAVLTMVLCAAAWSGSLFAATGPPVKKQFNVEAQPLKKAVVLWSLQADVPFLLDIDPLTSPSSSAVKGALTAEEALTQLLVGTHMTYSVLPDGRVNIRAEATKAETNRTTDRQTSSQQMRDRSRSEEKVPIRLTEVVVTGTNIPESVPVGVQVTVLTAEDIRSRGYPTIDHVLQTLSEFTRGGMSGESADARLSPGPRASSNITFAATANLRAVGPAATLVLVNGRRVVPSAQGFIDLSLISIDDVERIEILKDGASAIYGTDAIAGVVNIILKQDFDGHQTQARYAATTPSGQQAVSASHLFGRMWAEGGMVANASYMNRTPLTVDERRCTRDVPRPEAIYPSDKQLSVRLAAHHQLTPPVELQGEITHARIERYAQGWQSLGHLEFPIGMDRTLAGLGALYSSGTGWRLAANGYWSREDTSFSFRSFAPGSRTWDVAGSQVQHLTQELWVANVAASRPIAERAAGEWVLAVGTEHRDEGYRRELRSPTRGRERAERTVDAAYAELQVPVFSEAYNVTGAQALTLSFASRFERYSDIGSTANPKFAISWLLTTSLEAHATLGWSTRAPTMGEEFSSSARGTNDQVGIYAFQSADGSGVQPVAVLSGSDGLRAETARHWTAGITLQPERLTGWRFDVTYFDVNYSDRIIGPAWDVAALSNPDLQSFIRRYDTPAELQAALVGQTGDGLSFVDRTGEGYSSGAFGPNPEDRSTIYFDARLRNISVLRTDGVDAEASYSHGDRQTGAFELKVTGTYTNTLETVVAPGARRVNSLATTGYPARWKLAAMATYAQEEGWGAMLAWRLTDSYTDTSSADHHRVRSSMTVDAQLSYTFSDARKSFLDGLSARLSVSNVFDETPPDIDGSIANRWARYDTANAEPLGRQVSLELTKPWK